MAIENLKGTNVTAKDSSNSGQPNVKDYGEVIRNFTDDFTVSTGASSGSTYRAIRLPSNARIIYGTIRGVGSLDLPDVDVGAIHVSDSSIVDDDSFITGLDVDDTGKHDFAGRDIAGFDSTKELWEYTNATSDPGGEIDLLFSLDADAVAVGTATVQVQAVV